MSSSGEPPEVEWLKSTLRPIIDEELEYCKNADAETPKMEPKKNIPLYLGEGANRIQIGLADVDENGFATLKIDPVSQHRVMKKFIDLPPMSISEFEERHLKPFHDNGTDELRRRFWLNPDLPDIHPVEGE